MEGAEKVGAGPPTRREGIEKYCFCGGGEAAATKTIFLSISLPP
jgi:hypothetical protein